ncbi:hypothetical protein V6N11_014068 [Hibiscus sabdariffa]|uniref:Uncharacterized protein n=1 Tax=Hibiscus sabdariffa TaxID=183260 RepID=A0ABR2AFH3_9ROSI
MRIQEHKKAEMDPASRRKTILLRLFQSTSSRISLLSLTWKEELTVRSQLFFKSTGVEGKRPTLYFSIPKSSISRPWPFEGAALSDLFFDFPGMSLSHEMKTALSSCIRTFLSSEPVQVQRSLIPSSIEEDLLRYDISSSTSPIVISVNFSYNMGFGFGTKEKPQYKEKEGLNSDTTCHAPALNLTQRAAPPNEQDFSLANDGSSRDLFTRFVAGKTTSGLNPPFPTLPLSLPCFP